MTDDPETARRIPRNLEIRKTPSENAGEHFFWNNVVLEGILSNYDEQGICVGRMSGNDRSVRSSRRHLSALGPRRDRGICMTAAALQRGARAGGIPEVFRTIEMPVEVMKSEDEEDEDERSGSWEAEEVRRAWPA